MFSRRISKVLLVIILVFLVGGFIVFELQKPSKAMRELQLGSSYDQLISLAGDPDYVTDGTVDVEPAFIKSNDQLIHGCVKEA
jgi:hypothetical protein